MPELPDVEHFKSVFNQDCPGRTIETVESSDKRLIRKIVFDDFKRKLSGQKLGRAKRRGKFLIIPIQDTDLKLVMHFGMTGDLKYADQEQAPDKFARVVFKFENGYELRWLNTRKLGKIFLVKDLDQIDLLKKMGPEPLEITKKEFMKLLDQHSRKNIKSFLMDQKDIAGIGNIFSDEILYQARIDPHLKINQLSEEQKQKIFFKMRYVLSKASQPGPIPGVWLLPWRRSEMKCPQGHQLKREQIAGRSAHFCPICQGPKAKKKFL